MDIYIQRCFWMIEQTGSLHVIALYWELKQEHYASKATFYCKQYNKALTIHLVTVCCFQISGKKFERIT